ncbi:uncharacterized protein MYCFIDRAFT_85030 [Pseudocercospora fijiensis CIRAD86]|uniref:NADAR domain-containing protein n=1 Tax=Pseudocercospora fijiensis (strain CIRAD86) TaxID=383855 RepID=N1QBM4_PSEFD|nr:uncharacterized protein MYCFIDRAFT_85030 [Pseudocercospora fijiensis CIRAD86]EME88583.1 hypothetical protein MYCFIDRAFT_85030 [Pseudocercospora fijiensis CIRAD86]
MPQPSTSTSQPPIYFWREFTEPHGFMSQWYLPSPFTVQGITYQTAEMWMMIEKNPDFLETRTSKIGKIGEGGLRERGRWDENKSRIVEEGNFYKFSENEGLKKKLLETGERELVEASPNDRIWGIGFGEEDAEENRGRWGENRLGVALMNVRRRLREGEE